ERPVGEDRSIFTVVLTHSNLDLLLHERMDRPALYTARKIDSASQRGTSLTGAACAAAPYDGHRSTARSPDGAQRNPGLPSQPCNAFQQSRWQNMRRRFPRISLRSIRATVPQVCYDTTLS